MPQRITVEHRDEDTRPAVQAARARGAVWVGAGSRWANPFTTSLDLEASRMNDHGTQLAEYLEQRANPPDGWINLHPSYPTDAEIRAELAGKPLACGCPPEHTTCHAAALLRVANGGAQ